MTSRARQSLAGKLVEGQAGSSKGKGGEGGEEGALPTPIQKQLRRQLERVQGAEDVGLILNRTR